MRWQSCRLDELEPRELYAMLRLRSEIFVVEQDCAYLDADGLDLDAWHLQGWDGDVLAAHLRVLAPGVSGGDVSIGRVVVAASHRGRQLGRALMEQGIALAQRVHGDVPIHVSAQAHLERFYGSLGFVTVGEGYLEDGIPHLPMRRA